MIRPIKKEYIKDKIIKAIKDYILEKQLVNGDKLPTERYLSDMMIVSRNMIREAISCMETEGILEKKPAKGIYVKNFGNKIVIEQLLNKYNLNELTLSDMYEVRRCLEYGIADLIIDRILPNEIEELKRKIKSMESDNLDEIMISKIDLEFHKILIRSTKNKAITKLGLINLEFFEKLEEERPQFKEEIQKKTDIKKHKDILDAIIKKDKKILGKTILKHFEYI